ESVATTSRCPRLTIASPRDDTAVKKPALSRSFQASTSSSRQLPVTATRIQTSSCLTQGPSRDLATSFGAASDEAFGIGFGRPGSRRCPVESEQAVCGVPRPDASQDLGIVGDRRVTEAGIEMALVRRVEDGVEASVEQEWHGEVPEAMVPLIGCLDASGL